MTIITRLIHEIMVTYTISFNGKSAVVSKKAAEIINTVIDALVGYDQVALDAVKKPLDLLQPGLPGSGQVFIIKGQVERNRDAAKMLTPKETKTILLKPAGATIGSDEK